MKSIKSLVTLFTALTMMVVLTACPKQAVVPDKAVVNGVLKVDKAKGSVDLSISAFTGENLLESGSIGQVSATVTNPKYQAKGSTCSNNNISSRGSLTAVLTLDGSGSMSGSDPNRKRNEAAKALVQRMSSQDKAAVSWFSSGFTPVQGLTSDKSLLNSAIDKATKASGGTRLWLAGVKSIEQIQSVSGNNKVIVLFTDGRDSSNRAPLITAAKAANVRVFMIGLGNSSAINVAAMQDVANQTGGFYKNVDDAQNLIDLFDSAFNAAKAAGCVNVLFNPVPTTGTTLTGEVSFSVNNAPFKGSYEVTF